jgi:hypothetical protein
MAGLNPEKKSVLLPCGVRRALPLRICLIFIEHFPVSKASETLVFKPFAPRGALKTLIF